MTSQREDTTMKFIKQTRRAFLGTAAGAVTAGSFTKFAIAQKLTLPTHPVTLSIIDVAGNLALTQPAFEAYRKAKPNLVSKITFTKAPAPELPGKLKAQQDAGRVDIDMVLTGSDGLAAGIEQKLWVELLPAMADSLPKLNDILLPSALKMQGLAQGQGVIVVTSPGGPLLEYAPERVKQAPTTTDELLAWAKANPNRFMYARPANSGPGRAFMMGLPYLLGDKDPKDPVKGWDKTWAYLTALNEFVEYYPTGTGATLKEFGEGSRDIIASMTGWDINPRALGVVPKSAAIQPLKGFSFVTDGHYMCVPKGLAADKMAVIIDMMGFMLTKEAQAFTYDAGYFYPGPAVKGVTLDMAPAESQAVIKEFGRPEYDKMIADTPAELPLDPDKMVIAFRMWDEKVGAKTKK
jgi:putative spermidine/putrescine transport system substrate-binding protein